MYSTQKISVKPPIESGVVPPLAGMGSPSGSNMSAQFGGYEIIHRNGAVVGFQPSKIAIAVTKAFPAVNGEQGAASVRALMEKDPTYSRVTARLLMHAIRKEVFGKEVAQADTRSAPTWKPGT